MSAMTMKSSGAGGCLKIVIGGILILMLMVLLQEVDLLLVSADQKAAAHPCIQSERRALLRFKAAIDDRYGLLSSWGTDDEDAHNPNCCQWKGVTCNHLTGHVQRLDLHADFKYDYAEGGYYVPYLSGEIHTSLIELQQLQYLNLSWNYFADSHIPEFFASMSNLRYLDLSYCDFVGKILSRFGTLSHLKYLNLGWNSLEGSIPYQLGNLSKLQYLDLSGNYLNGTIPSQLGNLSSLHELYLGQYYSYEGALKIDMRGRWLSTLTSLTHLDLSRVLNLNTSQSWLQMIGKLPKLKELNLVDCGLSNHFIPLLWPSKINFSTSLSVLYLSGNAFTSPSVFQWVSNVSFNLVELNLSGNLLQGSASKDFVYAMIGKLPKLRKLWLSGCNFSDYFLLSLTPSRFNFSTSLSVFDLSQNSFTSFKIFECVSNISPNLIELNLYGNLLEGNKSGHFGTIMNSLEQLNLSGNRLKGGDLKSFMNICTLHSLYVRGNDLTEDLPSIVHNFSIGCARHSLQELDLSQNKIIGTLSDLSIFTSLKTLDLSENRLSGNLLESSKLPPKLESLSIRSNALEGGIPKSFGNICTLGSLDLSNSSLSEELPVIIHHLSGCARHSLKELLIGMNQISGTLPDLSMFYALRKLDLSDNQLNGKIPIESRLPSQLEDLSIRSNSLEGGIPKSFGNTCTLSSLDFSNNSLSEELWVIIHNLSGCARYSLEEVDLGMNEIQGRMPDISMFPSLKALYLYGNKLNGTIPEDIQFPSQLEYLDINSNCLEGMITESHFANMSQLRGLDLSDNSVAIVFSQNWIPPFQLDYIGLRSCQLGPHFPKWLQTQNKLHSLDISNAGISDIVPEWFWTKLGLNVLASMNISYNNLTGPIPNLPLITSDYFLTLASNQFEGSIPSFLRGAITLDLSRNKFSDSHSFVCTNGTSETLSQLDLSNNQLFGQIPDCWSHLKSLVYLDLSHNNFSGMIPASVGSLLELQALILRNNSLSEEIPSSMKNCTKLVMLDVRENKLSGQIPSWIGNRLQQLHILSLRKNHLFGSLPLQLCYLQSIQLIDLSLNNLSGQVPKCIKNLTLMAQKNSSNEYSKHTYLAKGSFGSMSEYFNLNAFLMWKGAEQMFENNELSLLKSIDFSSNQLTGEIPTELENLLELVSLNLSRNNLTGEIPLNIGRLTSLEFLDLSRNQLSGSIPASLAQIDRLTMLDVSHNHLSGEIPIGTQLQSFTAISYEDNPSLCGKPLEKLCIVEEPPQEPMVKFHEGEHLSFTHAFYMSMEFGFVVGFWGIFGSILVKRSWRHAYFRFLNNLTDNIYVLIAVKVIKYKRWIKG